MAVIREILVEGGGCSFSGVGVGGIGRSAMHDNGTNKPVNRRAIMFAKVFFSLWMTTILGIILFVGFNIFYP